MEDKITEIKIVNIDAYLNQLKEQIKEIIKNSTYIEINNYLEVLPLPHHAIHSWAYGYINEYYKIIGKLEKIEGIEIEELKHKIYALFLQETYETIKFTYNEFITFSKLLNTTFSDYNPESIKYEDKHPFISGNEEIDKVVNSIAKSAVHSEAPHAYEMIKSKLIILLKVLENKKRELLADIFDQVDLDEPLIVETLSSKRLRELKYKKEKLKLR